MPFTPKNYQSEMVWYFIGVYIINGILHGRLEIRNFSSRVEKMFHLFAALTREIFFNTRSKSKSNSIESATPLLYSQTSRENATSSSDTSPPASNKEVPPPRQNIDLTKSSLYRQTQSRSAIFKIIVSRYNE